MSERRGSATEVAPSPSSRAQPPAQHGVPGGGTRCHDGPSEPTAPGRPDRRRRGRKEAPPGAGPATAGADRGGGTPTVILRLEPRTARAPATRGWTGLAREDDAGARDGRARLPAGTHRVATSTEVGGEDTADLGAPDEPAEADQEPRARRRARDPLRGGWCRG